MAKFEPSPPRPLHRAGEFCRPSGILEVVAVRVGSGSILVDDGDPAASVPVGRKSPRSSSRVKQSSPRSNVDPTLADDAAIAHVPIILTVILGPIRWFHCRVSKKTGIMPIMNGLATRLHTVLKWLVAADPSSGVFEVASCCAVWCCAGSPPPWRRRLQGQWCLVCRGRLRDLLLGVNSAAQTFGEDL